MIVLERLSQYLDALQTAKAGAATLSTNFYATPTQIDSWIGRRSLSLLTGPESLLLFRQDRGFMHLAYTVSSPDRLTQALSHPEIPTDQSLTVDLIGNRQTVILWSTPFQAHGFLPYRELVRMTRTGPDESLWATSTEVVTAEPGDASAILTFMEALLDPLAEQIPEIADLEAWASQDRILLVRDGATILGLLIFEKTGLAGVLRYWFVAEGTKGRGIGAKLIRTFFHLCRDCRRITLWVFSDNRDSIAKYEHYGFRLEPLFDQILLRNAQFNCKERS